jgi:hypothetical protein
MCSGRSSEGCVVNKRVEFRPFDLIEFVQKSREMHRNSIWGGPPVGPDCGLVSQIYCLTRVAYSGRSDRPF